MNNHGSSQILSQSLVNPHKSSPNSCKSSPKVSQVLTNPLLKSHKTSPKLLRIIFQSLTNPLPKSCESSPKVLQILMNPFPKSCKSSWILFQSVMNPHKSSPKVSQILMNPWPKSCKSLWILTNLFLIINNTPYIDNCRQPTNSDINTALIFIDMHMNIGAIVCGTSFEDSQGFAPQIWNSDHQCHIWPTTPQWSHSCLYRQQLPGMTVDCSYRSVRHI